MLVITNLKDTIVQKSIKLILDEVFIDQLSRFSTTVRGFVPKANCHRILQHIKAK